MKKKNRNPKNKEMGVFYNLPKKVVFCRECFMSNQRPNMQPEHYNDDNKTTTKFTKDLCDACKWNSEKKDIDWKEREHKLRKLLDKYRSRNGSYDVVVPGSGGKDSFYTWHILKKKYNMNPITCTFAPHIYTKWGNKNLYNWIDSGCSNYLFTSDNRVHRMITRLATEKLFHPFQPWVLGQKNYPVKFAAMMKIPFIMYGENPAEYGNPHDIYDDNMNKEWFVCDNQDEIIIGGYEIKKLKKDLKLSNAELEPYVPITSKGYDEANIKYSPLSYFIPWHPQGNYYYTVENSKNFTLSDDRSTGTYTRYSSIDDKMDDLYYYTCFIKFGLGKVHYDVAVEIRNGDITKEEGKKLIRKYNGEYPKRWMKELCDYLSINPNESPEIKNIIKDTRFDETKFNALADKARSPHLWKLEKNKWKLKNSL